MPAASRSRPPLPTAGRPDSYPNPNPNPNPSPCPNPNPNANPNPSPYQQQRRRSCRHPPRAHPRARPLAHGACTARAAAGWLEHCTGHAAAAPLAARAERAAHLRLLHERGASAGYHPNPDSNANPNPPNPNPPNPNPNPYPPNPNPNPKPRASRSSSTRGSRRVHASISAVCPAALRWSMLALCSRSSCTWFGSG